MVAAVGDVVGVTLAQPLKVNAGGPALTARFTAAVAAPPAGVGVAVRVPA